MSLYRKPLPYRKPQLYRGSSVAGVSPPGVRAVYQSAWRKPQNRGQQNRGQSGLQNRGQSGLV